jgi:hypothetical protein
MKSEEGPTGVPTMHAKLDASGLLGKERMMKMGTRAMLFDYRTADAEGMTMRIQRAIKPIVPKGVGVFVALRVPGPEGWSTYMTSADWQDAVQALVSMIEVITDAKFEMEGVYQGGASVDM